MVHTIQNIFATNGVQSEYHRVPSRWREDVLSLIRQEKHDGTLSKEAASSGKDEQTVLEWIAELLGQMSPTVLIVSLPSVSSHGMQTAAGSQDEFLWFGLDCAADYSNMTSEELLDCVAAKSTDDKTIADVGYEILRRDPAQRRQIVELCLSRSPSHSSDSVVVSSVLSREEHRYTDIAIQYAAVTILREQKSGPFDLFILLSNLDVSGMVKYLDEKVFPLERSAYWKQNAAGLLASEQFVLPDDLRKKWLRIVGAEEDGGAAKLLRIREEARAVMLTNGINTNLTSEIGKALAYLEKRDIERPERERMRRERKVQVFAFCNIAEQRDLDAILSKGLKPGDR
jgi:hypothetical protein